MARPILAASMLLALLLLPGSTADGSLSNEPVCQPSQASASFGILSGGTSPLQLLPLDLLGVQTSTALPLANPVLTAQLPGIAAIARPVLVAKPGDRHEAFLFFAARECDGADNSPGRWGIAAAASMNGGWSWKPLGWVLRGHAGDDLRGATVFENDGSWYMLVEPAGASPLQLYRASRFPTAWQLDRELLLEGQPPLQSASIVRHEQQWWLLGSRPGAGHDGQDHLLAIYHSDSPEGPWQPHLGNGTFASLAGATEGAAFIWDGRLLRLGRACRHGACGPAELLEVSVSDGSFNEAPLPLDLGQPLWRQRSCWDSAGWTALSIARRADGAFLAVVEGRRLPHVAPALPRQLEAAVAALKTMALLSIGLLLLSGAARMPTLRGALLRHPWGRPLLAFALLLHGGSSGKRRCAAGEVHREEHPGGKVQLVVHSSEGSSNGSSSIGGFCVGSACITTSQPRSRCGSASGAVRSSADSGWSAAGTAAAHGGRSPQPRWSRLRLPRCWPLLALVALGMLAVGGWLAARTAARIAAPFAEQPVAVPVRGQYSRFTLMVMSYDKRLRELQWYVRHYSRCPSVGEVLVVWNRGPPPNPITDFDSAVPVRVRVEPINSMNNRFKPDKQLRFRSVLSLDDDILLPCSDVEEAFAEWRAEPQRLLGFYPRLLLPAAPGGPPVYQFEEYVFQQRAYNTILAGAAFMDSATFFPLYFSAAAAPARALVDEVFNCDDLLLNFVVSNWTVHNERELPPPVQLVRPRRRLDVSRLSGVGISHNPARFKAAADRCLREFSTLFGSSPLMVQRVPDDYGSPPSCHVLNLDCMYLSNH